MSPTRGLPESEAETSTVRFGNATIKYFIRRSPARKTVSIAVHPGLGVVVTAPESSTRSRLDAVVHGKASWIVAKIRQEGGVQPGVPKREFVDGETFLYLGRQYRLKVVRETREGCVGLQGGRLIVSLPGAAKGQQEAAKAVRKALVGWYREKAAARLAERVQYWVERLEVEPPAILIREQGQRWASCDRRGTLRFNWRIVQAPRRLLDYVVAHELCHLRIKEHSPKFWRMLARVVPDLEERRATLKAAGPRLLW